jgi:hypothetical protein
VTKMPGTSHLPALRGPEWRAGYALQRFVSLWRPQTMVTCFRRLKKPGGRVTFSTSSRRGVTSDTDPRPSRDPPGPFLHSPRTRPSRPRPQPARAVDGTAGSGASPTRPHPLPGRQLPAAPSLIRAPARPGPVPYPGASFQRPHPSSGRQPDPAPSLTRAPASPGPIPHPGASPTRPHPFPGASFPGGIPSRAPAGNAPIPSRPQSPRNQHLARSSLGPPLGTKCRSRAYERDVSVAYDPERCHECVA